MQTNGAKGPSPATAAATRAQLHDMIESLAAAMTVNAMANQADAVYSTDSPGSSPALTTSSPVFSPLTQTKTAFGGMAKRASAAVAANNDDAQGVGTVVGMRSSYTPAAARLQTLTATHQRVRQLLGEYEAAELAESAGEAAALRVSVAAGEGGEGKGGACATAPLVAVRAWNSQRKFAELCELGIRPSPVPGATTTGTTSTAVALTAAVRQPFLSYGEAASRPGGNERPAAAAAALQPFVKLQEAFRELTECKNFSYEEELRARARGEAPAPSPKGERGSGALAITAAPTTSHQVRHLPLLVQRMVDTLTELREAWLNPGAGARGGKGAPSSASTAMPSLVSAEYVKRLFADVAQWPQPLLRLMNETLQAPTLEAITEETRERLRRAAFDVEELSHEQEQAVTDGDMHRSEDLYFQQSDLLESMKPLFDKLEYIMTTYEERQVEKPRDQLKTIQRQFTTLYQEAVRKEEATLRKTTEDLEKLQAHRVRVQQVRQQQRAGVAEYTTGWTRLYEGNARQQEECLRAMEQLEARMRELAQEQSFLILDRLEKVQEERQRREAAAAFEFFIDAHSASMRETERELRVLVDGLRQVGSALEFSCGHFEAYLRDVLREHVKRELLASRKERLNQFRTLYLTLGDLHFKKARHADEIAKKVEYYHIQQELAMDALNPKAKEFSQARQKWEMVQREVDSQLRSIEARTQQQIEDFRPTEQLLLESGEKFVHPAQELEQRNAVRQQKLLEYKELMDSRVRGGEADGAAASLKPAPAAAGQDPCAEEILAEDMRMFRRNAPRLQSTEEMTVDVRTSSGGAARRSRGK